MFAPHRNLITKTLITQLKLILEKQEWDKTHELKKKMLLVLQELQNYQMRLRNNQEEYELLLKIQFDYQQLILEMNLLQQNQEKLNLARQKEPTLTLAENSTYSSLPRLEPKYQPFSRNQKESES